MGFFLWFFVGSFVVVALPPGGVCVPGFYTVGLPGENGDHQCEILAGNFELHKAF